MRFLQLIGSIARRCAWRTSSLVTPLLFIWEFSNKWPEGGFYNCFTTATLLISLGALCLSLKVAVRKNYPDIDTSWGCLSQLFAVGNYNNVIVYFVEWVECTSNWKESFYCLKTLIIALSAESNFNIQNKNIKWTNTKLYTSSNFSLNLKILFFIFEIKIFTKCDWTRSKFRYNKIFFGKD